MIHDAQAEGDTAFYQIMVNAIKVVVGQAARTGNPQGVQKSLSVGYECYSIDTALKQGDFLCIYKKGLIDTK